MIRSEIVEIDGAFDETQTEKSNIKIQIPLRIARDRSDMMKSANFVFHFNLGNSTRVRRVCHVFLNMLRIRTLIVA
jgi:hypothetical protein